MKAAWDWHLPRTTAEEERALVAFTHELGFDTLIVHDPTPGMMDAAGALGIKVVAIVTPDGTPEFAQRHPDAFQEMLPAENAVAAASRSLDWESYPIQAHRWFPLVQSAPLLCFEHPAARAELKTRIDQALAFADGVAFDGFGFRNHYACHCRRCQDIRREMAADDPDTHVAKLIAEMSETSLVKISRVLYQQAKSINPDAIVTNHLWPPFRPNPDYGNRLKLDYCSQTISWFYKPNWSLERVEFEASHMKRLERPENNRFVPFIGLFDDPYLVRPAARITAELEIAGKYGDGHLIFCNLKSLSLYPDLAAAVTSALAAA